MFHLHSRLHGPPDSCPNNTIIVCVQPATSQMLFILLWRSSEIPVKLFQDIYRYIWRSLESMTSRCLWSSEK
ncbi:hypothetical protein X801_00220, partial [Opisthorchis viverrini]